MAVFPANFTVIFHQPESTLINQNGTPESEVSAVVLVASVRESTSSGRTQGEFQRNDDSDLLQPHLTGRCITPKALPNTIKPGSTGKAYLWRLDNALPRIPSEFASVEILEAFAELNAANIVQTGVFSLQAGISSRFKVQQILGDKLTGILTTETAWDEIA